MTFNWAQVRNEKTKKADFDCREHIKPGDVIKFCSMCGIPQNMIRAGNEPVKVSGIVTKVYERFVMVKLKNVVECCNRWDILEINGKKVMGRSLGHGSAGFMRGI